MAPETGAASQLGFDQIQSIKLSDNDLTATIQLKDVYAPFMAYVLAGAGDTGGGMLLPAHVFDNDPKKVRASNYGRVVGGKINHVGNGPFKIDEWDKGNRITTSRNENYFGKKPCLDGMVFTLFGADTDTQTTQLANGEIDLATNYTEGDIPTLEDLPDAQVIANPAVGSIERYYFNLKDPKDPNINRNPTQARPHPLFGDKNVRMAIAMGINRQAIVDELLYGETKVAVTELDNTPWFNQNLEP